MPEATAHRVQRSHRRAGQPAASPNRPSGQPAENASPATTSASGKGHSSCANERTSPHAGDPSAKRSPPRTPVRRGRSGPDQPAASERMNAETPGTALCHRDVCATSDPSDRRARGRPPDGHRVPVIRPAGHACLRRVSVVQPRPRRRWGRPWPRCRIRRPGVSPRVRHRRPAHPVHEHRSRLGASLRDVAADHRRARDPPRGAGVGPLHVHRDGGAPGGRPPRGRPDERSRGAERTLQRTGRSRPTTPGGRSSRRASRLRHSLSCVPHLHPEVRGARGPGSRPAGFLELRLAESLGQRARSPAWSGREDSSDLAVGPDEPTDCEVDERSGRVSCAGSTAGWCRRVQDHRRIFVPLAVPAPLASRHSPDWTPVMVPLALTFHCWLVWPLQSQMIAGGAVAGALAAGVQALVAVHLQLLAGGVGPALVRPPRQSHSCAWVPLVVLEPGTSMQRPGLPPRRPGWRRSASRIRGC